MGIDFHNKKLGLIGFGRIGKKIAKRAKAFDYKLIISAVIKKKVILKSIWCLLL